MQDNKDTTRTPTRETVEYGLALCDYKYDHKKGWLKGTDSICTSYSPTKMSSDIRNALETMTETKWTIPSKSNIIDTIDSISIDAQNKHATARFDDIRFDKTAQDTSVELCKLISGDKYDPIYPHILRQWIYSVKRKSRGDSVRCPLLPMFYGGAGTGKSTFIRSLCSPIPENKYVFFKNGESIVNSEKHTQMLLDHSIIHIDEMAGMQDGHIDKLKSMLDMEYVSYVPLYTNTSKSGFVTANFIAASNSAINTLLVQTEDIRKWVQINFYEPPDDESREEYIRKQIDAIQSFDYVNLWKSVDENGVEPISDPTIYTQYLEYVKRVCSSTTPTSDWIDSYIQNHDDSWILKTELYDAYYKYLQEKKHKKIMGKDKFYELCQKRGMKLKRQGGTGDRGFYIPEKDILKDILNQCVGE